MLMLICDGEISQTSGELICDTGWQTQTASLPFNITQIDPSTATTFFAIGFFLCLVPVSAAWGIKTVLGLIDLASNKRS